MGLIASAYARLSQHDAVRGQVLAHLFFARVHNSIKSSYERYLEDPPGHMGHNNNGHHREGLAAKSRGQQPASLIGQLTHRRRGSKKLSPDRERAPHERGRSENAPTLAPSVERAWDWCGFPVQRRHLALYDLFCICWMSLASLRTIFHKQLAALVEPLSRWLLNGRPGNCLLMGRMVNPSGISDAMIVLVASWHLGWRFMQTRARRSRLMTMIVFLLASERDLERVYASIGSGMTGDGEHFALPGRHLPDDCDEEELVQTGLTSAPSTTPTVASQNERLFRQVMCYQVHRDRRVYLRLRPNRTREARKLLEQRMAIVSIITIAFFALEFMIGQTILVACILSDYRYARTYPGCCPLLDERIARGELTFFSSFTLRDHHLLSACVDFLESFVFWVDSGLALTFVPAFTYMLNYDLLLYWSELNQKLESIVGRSKHAHLTELLVSHQSRLESARALASEINELSSEMFDFFHQVRRADLIVGDTLTHAILIWLSGCAFVSYCQFTYGESSMYLSAIMKLILILGFFVISLATYHLLELRRCCLRSHRALCSLTAFDQTCKERHFVKLMDFYLSTQNATTYHLCRTYAYEPTTFITIIGWTFSCFFVAFTLLKPPGYGPRYPYNVTDELTW